MARPKVDLDFSKDAILWRLHKSIAEFEDVMFTPGSLAGGLNIPIQVVEVCIEELRSSGYCERSADKRPRRNHDFIIHTGLVDEDATYVRITSVGIQAVENWSDDHHNGIADSLGFFEDETPSNPVVPASDRVVELNHNSAEYRDTVESVDEVIEELRKDQPLDNELGPQKHRLIQAVENGRRLLDDTRMDVEIGVKLLLEPLRLVAKKYKQVALGALAGKAVDLVSRLLGLG